MSDVSIQPGDHADPHDGPHGDHAHHNPHLAHHFESPEQQFGSAKVGMWVFLGTELLMFGGLFGAYSVYRANHPEVFLYAPHKYLDPVLGGINTLILIASSFTMAWGVRAAQLGQKMLLTILLAFTFMGGVGFLVIKTVEYHAKYEHGVWFGTKNIYSTGYKPGPNDLPPASAGHGPAAIAAAPTAPADAGSGRAPNMPEEGGVHSDPTHGMPAASATPVKGDEHAKVKHTPESAPPVNPYLPRHPTQAFLDPNAGSADEVKIKPNYNAPAGLIQKSTDPGPLGSLIAAHHGPEYDDLDQLDRDRIATFFNIYFAMTGLHGVHVLVGMGLIGWIFIRSTRGEFGPGYFTPVDLVGLYWHLVDLIWIFLFPLLYLIH